ncbi:MAG: CAP domain-containing protein [Armatimonadetes bacterium]|nr:CAP domain-containing protein [Armatimonadota bacterium]
MLKLLALAVLFPGVQDPDKSETAFTVPGNAPPTEEQGFAIEVLNGFRSLHGLDAVSLDSRLVSSAESHSRAMAKSKFLTHKEEDGAMADASRRSRSFGFEGPVAELVASGMPNVPYSIASFMDAPYHRRLLLRPGKLSFGCAETDGFVCLVLGGTAAAGTVVSPPDGSQGVPTLWDGIEEPNPVRAKGARPPYGYPIAFYAFGRTLRDVKATFTEGSGAAVPFHLSEPGNDPHATDSVILVPKAPLTPSGSYTATVQASLDGVPTTMVCHFKTGAAETSRKAPEPGKKKKSSRR